MDHQIDSTIGDLAATDRYVPPAFEVISLDCEITAYAPDDDRPLF